jgi:hypothetical protein
LIACPVVHGDRGSPAFRVIDPATLVLSQRRPKVSDPDGNMVLQPGNALLTVEGAPSETLGS